MTKTIGLIGCGKWGKNILRDLVALNAKVLVNSPSAATRAFALQQGATEAHGSLSDIAERVDGFVVATPTSTHAAVIEQLLPFNKPLFVEKPLTSDVAFARHLAKISDGRIFVMDKWRYHAGIKTMAEQIAAGTLGTIELIRTYRLGWGNPHPDVSALWILLPHDLSIVLHLLGTLPPLATAVPLLSTDPTAGTMVTLKGPDTPTVIIEISTLSPSKRRSITVVGSRGTLELGDGYDSHIIHAEGAPADLNYQINTIGLDPTMPLYLELAAFMNYLRGGPPPFSSLAEGILIVERAAAVHDALGAL